MQFIEEMHDIALVYGFSNVGNQGNFSWHSYCLGVVRFIYGHAKMQTSSTTSVSSSASAVYSTALPDVSTDIATLNSDGIKALSTATISALTTAQLALIQPESIPGLTTAQLAALPTGSM